MISNVFLKYLLFSFSLLPFGLALGPAIPDIIISIGGIVFLLYLFINKELSYLKNKFFLVFLLICLYLIFTSIISTNILLSFESSLFYFRFGIMTLIIIYLCKNTQFLKYFTISLTITLLFVSIDGFIEYFSKNSLLYNLFFGQSGMFNKHCTECSNYFGRISGIFGEELILGSYLVRFLPICIGLLLFNFETKKILIFSY